MTKSSKKNQNQEDNSQVQMVSSLQRRWSQLKHQASPISVEGGRLLFTILGKSNGKKS